MKGSVVMRPQSRNMPEQEHSIKVRSNELFYEETVVPTRTTRPFVEYLRETPAKPMAGWLQLIFAIVGVIVGALFLVALWRVSHPHLSKKPGIRPTTASTAMADAQRSHQTG